MSSELSTAISGRCLEERVWPLSFKEFLDFGQKNSATQDELLLGLDEYLTFGGLPEVILSEDREMKEKILNQYASDIIYKDVIQRHKIRNVMALNQILIHYYSNPASLHSYTAIKKAYGMTADTASEYTDYLKDAFVVSEVARYHSNLKIQARDAKKIYVTDTGLRNMLSKSFSRDRGKLYENIVFNELTRRGKQVYYFKQEQEVDFITVDGMTPTQAIQVCSSNMDDSETFRRETASALACLETTHLNEALIITHSRKEIIRHRQYQLKLVPLYEWLLDNN